jgi:hypothetical protein
VNLDPNGKAAQRLSAVIPFFDKAIGSLGELNKITNVFDSAINTAPFNSFIIGNRNVEIHLPTKPVMSYPAFPIGADFQYPDSLPWAITLSGEYTPLVPGVKT